VDGYRLQGGHDDQVEVLKRDGTDQDFVSHHECPAEGVPAGERELHRANVRHPMTAAIGQLHLAFLDFIELRALRRVKSP